eukprot:224953-Rhodomonas_salina.1
MTVSHKVEAHWQSRVHGQGSRVVGQRGCAGVKSRVKGQGSRARVMARGRGSRVEGQGSRVTGQGSRGKDLPWIKGRVEGRGSRVESPGRGSRVE